MTATTEQQETSDEVEWARVMANKQQDEDEDDEEGLPPTRDTTNRWMLVFFQSLATIFMVGATLGWGPMQILVST